MSNSNFYRVTDQIRKLFFDMLPFPDYEDGETFSERIDKMTREQKENMLVLSSINNEFKNLDQSERDRIDRIALEKLLGQMLPLLGLTNLDVTDSETIASLAAKPVLADAVPRQIQITYYKEIIKKIANRDVGGEFRGAFERASRVLDVIEEPATKIFKNDQGELTVYTIEAVRHKIGLGMR